METALWFKMFLFLIVIGTFMSLVNTGGTPTFVVPTIPTTGWDLLSMVTTVWSFGIAILGFFTGIGALLGVGGVPILPVPFNWMLLVVIGAMWIFLIFEVVRTVAKSVLP